MKTIARDRWVWLLLLGWGTLSVAAIVLRPLWPVDETRYLSVAWEMWLRGDFLVPHLNGEPYSHKPPLLFWLIHLGWAVFGVNDWWPRLISPLCALAATALAMRLGDRLWPHAAPAHTPWVLVGTLLFAAFVTLVMFDLLLTVCVLLGMLGTLCAAQGERRGLLWLALGIGLGVLAKGPVILLHLLPVALAAPWWAPATRAQALRWYGGLLAAVLGGAAIALAWAIPAGIHGGEAYRNAIFWGQTAGRVAESFAHRAPWWYYLPMLPVLLLPWSLWPRLWRGLGRLAWQPRDVGVRFLAAWLVLGLLGFSLISGKQAKYLVPLMPGFALLIAYVLERLADGPRRWDMWPPALGLLLLPAALGYARRHPEVLELPAWVAMLPLWPVVLLALLSAAVLMLGRASQAWQVRGLAFTTLGVFSLLYVALVPLLVPFSDPRPVAWHLRALQQQGIPVAYLGKYHGQFNFVGRLTEPIAILDNDELDEWVARHPAGRVIVLTRRPLGAAPNLELETAYRGATLQIWIGAPPADTPR